MKFGQFSELKANEVLMWGKGPSIVVMNTGNAYGKFTPGSKTVKLNETYAREFERLKGKDSYIMMFIIGITLLHELVHYGDDQDGIDTPGEEGEMFENYVYGEFIGKSNAKSKLQKWINKQQDQKKDQITNEEETSDEEKKNNWEKNWHPSVQ